MGGELRDVYRPFYDTGTGEVGYLVESGERTLRMVLPRPALGATEGQISESRPLLRSHDREDWGVIDLDNVEHFEP